MGQTLPEFPIGTTTAIFQSMSTAVDAAAVRTILGAYSSGEVDSAIAAAISSLIAAAPGALDTLDELANALGDDANFAATMTTALAGKLAISSNLADLGDASAARSNLGLGTAATTAATDYATAAQGAKADSALQPANIASGTITARTGSIDFSGGSDGDVMTVQADGSLAPETPAAGGAGTSDGFQVPYTTDSDVYVSLVACRHGDLGIAADVLCKVPFLVGVQGSFTTAAIVVKSTGTATEARLGIRNMDTSTGEPTTLVQDLGTVDVTSTGTKQITGLTIDLDPGWYYLEMVADGTFTTRAGQDFYVPSPLGVKMLTTGSWVLSCLTRAFTYGALPADETGVSQTPSLSGNTPIIGLR